MKTLGNTKKIAIFANTDWYLYNFRLPLIKELIKQGYEVLLLSPSGDYAHQFAKSDIRWLPIEFSRRGVNPIREFMPLVQLVKILRKEKPDILQTFTLKSNLLGAIAGKFFGSIRIVHSITGLGYVFGQKMQNSLLPGILLSAMRLFFRNSQVIFQNTDNMNFLMMKGVVKKRNSNMIPGSGVDINHFTPQPEMEGRVLVVFPSRYLREKGVIEFIEAARILRGLDIDARFAMVGSIDDGNPASLTAEELVELNREGIVEDWGWRDDMREVYRLAHIICLPSSYGEGLPKVLIEAAASGRAIVATDIPGCNDVVIHGKTGILVPVRNADSLSEALKGLIQNPELRKKMGREGRLRAEKEFSTTIINQQTIAVYSQG